MALLAIWFAKRPSTPEKTYGYYRAEILAALGNGVVLMLVSFYIIYEGWLRVQNPPHVESGSMLAIAVLGLGVNIAGIKLLHGSAGQSLNLQGAYLEVLSDLIGSFGVIAASLIMLTTGWLLADPIISMGIGLFIIPRTWKLLKEAAHILMEGTPARFDVRALEKAVRSVPGVIAVHDLHVWTITSGWNALSGHFVVQRDVDSDLALSELQRVIREQFGIQHTTLQLEREALVQIRERG